MRLRIRQCCARSNVGHERSCLVSRSRTSPGSSVRAMKSRWKRRNCLTSPTSTPQSATVRVPARGRQGGPAERRTLQPHGDAKQLTPAAILICVAGRILEAAWKEAEQAAAALERSKVLHAARTALARAGVGFVPRANHSLQITPSAPSGGRWQSVAPSLPSCTNWTSLVPPLVLTGHAAARCAGSRHLDDSGRSCPDPQTAESLEPIFVFMWGFEPRDLCRRGDSGFVHFSTPPTASLPLSAPPGVIFWLVLEESQKVLRRATKGVAQAEGSSSAAPAGKQ